MQLARPKQSRAAGSAVAASVSDLVALQGAGERIDLESLRSARSRALLAGPYRSPFRGRGIEFDEVRAYQPGDDARFIDWRVSARRGRVYTKLFHEDRERPVLVLADAGPSMRFGTRGCFKSVAAVRAAAVLSFAAHHASDRIGGIALSPAGREEHPARRRQRDLLRWLDALARATSVPLAGATRAEGNAPDDFTGALARLARIAPSGSHAILISDFYGLDDAARLEIARLARHRQVTCVQVYDALEAEAPPPGRYRVSDGAQTSALETGGRTTRERWGTQFQARREALRALCVEHRIPLLPLRTDQSVVQAFAPATARRARA
jgi:uncharacterized protein (DUF58 family)